MNPFTHISAIALAVVCSSGADWPQFLGPNRNGNSSDAIGSAWENSPPTVLWTADAGEGFAGPVVAGNRVILFHRKNGKEVLDCFENTTGKVLWSNLYPATYRDDFGFDEGPRSTPCIDGGMMFSFGADGIIQAVELESGKTVWRVDAKERWEARKGFFGWACSPLAAGEHVLLNVGGKNAGIVALDRNTGRVAWTATNEEASYSSPVLAELGGKSRALFFARSGLVVLDPRSGEVHGRHPWRAKAHASVNAATPMVLGQRIFLSASYDTGAVMLEWKENGLDVLWSRREGLLNHYSTSVHHDGFLYGYDGRQEWKPALVCMDAATGQVRWSEEQFGAGSISLVGGKLLLLRERGELLMVNASPEKFEVLGRVHLMGNNTRAFPAFANGRMYARDANSLICVQFPPVGQTAE